MNNATLLRTGDKAVLRFERFLPRPIEQVWRAVTDPIEMRAWFPSRVDIDKWETGAKFTHYFDGGEHEPLPGEVLECSEPYRLVFTWGEDTIGFELASVKGGTTFVLTDELGVAIAARNAAGWEVCLERLTEGAVGEDWHSRFQRYAAAFEPVLGAQHRPPTQRPE